MRSVLFSKLESGFVSSFQLTAARISSMVTMPSTPILMVPFVGDENHHVLGGFLAKACFWWSDAQRVTIVLFKNRLFPQGFGWIF